jgi:hypothetical protein
LGNLDVAVATTGQWRRFLSVVPGGMLNKLLAWILRENLHCFSLPYRAYCGKTYTVEEGDVINGAYLSPY